MTKRKKPMVKTMAITHEQYFRNYQLSVEQYGEILVKVAYNGNKMPDHHKGYDIEATIKGKPERIEVKSKYARTDTGQATVVHVTESEMGSGGMTQLVVILVEREKEQPSVKEAWLLTEEQAAKLRRENTESKYINVKELREGGARGRGEYQNIEKELQQAAESLA